MAFRTCIAISVAGEEKTIEYAPSGKPHLADSSYFISISHTRGYVAVILSAVSEVGIDIEQYGQRVHKVAHKYMRPDELISEYQEKIPGLYFYIGQQKK